MAEYSIVLKSEEATVVTEYKPISTRSEAFQSEAELELEFIRLLEEQGYEYAPIHDEQSLIANLRIQLEKLNKIKFSDQEWDRFFKGNLSNNNLGIVEKTKIIQDDYRQVLRRDDGSSKNINLLDKNNIHNNYLQVIHQFEDNEGRKNRYDVTVLVNGLPLVHIELKRRGVQLQEAFNQIDRYQRDSFWKGSALFQYVQLFVISNGTYTKYFSNSTWDNHIKDQVNKAKKEKTSNSFEFTSYWADANNKVIADLIDFTKTFFAKHTLLNILTKYCVFTVENLLLVMRPYQIAATERILNRIEIANNYKTYGSIDGGGYIWHTTGSGKTLTSFKTARLASRLDYIDKVLFVVDRKDLDYQTMREYDRFEKGAANSNRSTEILKKQLEDPTKKIIITTIQKLSTFVKKNKGHEITNKRVVIIFDECHRSQFGEMHTDITKFFKKYNLFGFTGTPIFSVNATSKKDLNLQTTEQAFGQQLHTYTIVDAISDHNVLPFRVDYIKTIGENEEAEDKDVWDIDRERVYQDPRRIEQVTKYIIDHFDQKTYRHDKTYNFGVVTNISEVVASKNRTVEEKKQKARLSGFNSIFAVSSIDAAKLYYNAFKAEQAKRSGDPLKVGIIYSYGANEESDGILDEENSDDTSGLDQSSRDFLEEAIKDYNRMFNTNYDTSSDRFQNYYKDVSQRMKNKELDLLIVVNMFLTGFDATTLNTLWVDKNLKMHGLIQSYSRTNRILNSIKTFGNIVCFRPLQKKTDEAIALFGDKDASGIVMLKGFNDYYYGYDDEKGKHQLGYEEIVDKLEEEFPVTEPVIQSEKKQKEFIQLFGAYLRLRNVLSSFDDFAGKELLSERDFMNYQSMYLDMREEWCKRSKAELERINDDVVFELELLKQVEINIDYILILVQKYHDSHFKDKEILITIQKAVDSSMELRSKKALIESFLAGINEVDDVMAEWHKFISEEREKQLMQIITEENLKEQPTRMFVSDSFRQGFVKTTGTDVDKILPPISRFGGGNHDQKRQTVLSKIISFFERFFGIG